MKRTGRMGVPVRAMLLMGTLAAVLIAVPGCRKPNSILREEGVRALQAGRADLAERRFLVAVNQDPADWQAMYHLAVIYLDQDRPRDAQLLLERALSLRPHGPETPRIVDVLADAYARLGREDALRGLLKHEADRARSAEAYIRQARYLHQLGDIDGADAALAKAVYFADPLDPAPYVAQADFYEAVGDRDRALQALRHAYYLDPAVPTLPDRLRRHGLVPGPTVGLPPERPTTEP